MEVDRNHPCKWKELSSSFGIITAKILNFFKIICFKIFVLPGFIERNRFGKDPRHTNELAFTQKYYIYTFLLSLNVILLQIRDFKIFLIVALVSQVY